MVCALISLEGSYCPPGVWAIEIRVKGDDGVINLDSQRYGADNDGDARKHYRKSVHLKNLKSSSVRSYRVRIDD